MNHSHLSDSFFVDSSLAGFPPGL